MQYISEQSHGEPDFNLTYANGACALVEVTESIDRPWLEMTRAIQAKGTIQAKQCRFSWVVYPHADASLKNVRACADSLLAIFEDGGYHNSLDCVDWQLVDKMCRMGISMAMRVEQTANSPTIGIMRPGQSGEVLAEVFQRAIEREANKDDNKRKLSHFNGEGHLYVHIRSWNFLLQHFIIDSNPPVDILPIPAEMTHVWAGALSDSGREVIVWRAERAKPWQRAGVVKFTPEQMQEIFGV